MMTSMDRDLVLNILKCCFPLAKNVKIVGNTWADGNQHFTSNVLRLIVEYEEDGEIRQKKLIMKVPDTSSALIVVYESLGLFDREIYTYENVLPRINEYLRESLSPAHLFTSDSKILVLEDLTADGYESGEKFPFLDLFQAEGCMKALARFHAASHKLSEERPEDPSILQNLISSHFGELEYRKMTMIGAPIVFELLRRKGATRLVDMVAPAMAFLKKDDDEMRAFLDRRKFKFIVLNRGDCRKDNFFFRAASDNRVQVQLIDFQMSVWSSPVRDIVVLLTNSVSVEVIEAHFDELVNLYLDELNEELDRLQCASRYKRADFDEDVNTLRLFLVSCVTNSCLLIDPVLQMLRDETFVRGEADMGRIFDVCLNDEKYVSTIYRRLKFCETVIDNNY